MIKNLSLVSDIAVAVDFWSDKKAKSYFVLTGHFISEDFKSSSTILQFSTFEKRHFSDLIGKEIEKQLVDLNLFHKVTTITCDNAPNMLAMFQHFSRDMKHIPCMVHILHLVVCNALGIWQEDDHTEKCDKSVNNTDENSIAEGLNQSVRKMSINGDDNKPDQYNSQNDEKEDKSDEVSTVLKMNLAF